MTWTLQIDASGGGYTTVNLLRPPTFTELLNAMTRWRAQFHTTASISEGDKARIYWDLGGGNERLWVTGRVTHLSIDDTTGVHGVEGNGDEVLLAKSYLGGLRDYAATTPWGIVQQAGTPKGLTYNAQNSQVMPVATTATNTISAGTPGTAFTFRAHTTSCLSHIARLCDQSVVGGSQGLDWYVDRDGADNPRLHLVTLRQRAASYTNEAFTLGETLYPAPVERDWGTGVDRVKVIGEGSGADRIESSWVGAGTREYIHQDKGINTVAAADALAQRIYNELNANDDAALQGNTARHDLTTQVGDYVDLTDSSGTTTYRCLGINYDGHLQMFHLMLGHRRPGAYELLNQLGEDTGALGQSAQVTDVKPEVLFAGTTVFLKAPSNRGGTISIAPGASVDIVDTSVDGIALGALTDLGEAEAAFIQALIEADTTSPLETYQLANSPTAGTDAAGGGAVAEPHTHTLTYTATAVSRPGPLRVQVLADFSGYGTVVLAQGYIPAPPPTKVATITWTYPFAYEGATADFTPTKIRLNVTNHGNVAFVADSTGVTDATTQIGVWRNNLHKHNEVT